MSVAFIIAAPRSGTTFLEELFDQHPDVCGWHEPFFIWEYHLEKQEDDYLDSSHVTAKTQKFIQKEFDFFLKKSEKKLLLEKTPSNAFKIQYMHHIFPDAKWIHLYRDGRDVIASMKQRYFHRKQIVTNRNLYDFYKDVIYTLKRQPYWRHRLMSVWHELTTFNHLKPYLSYKNSDWSQSIGWGPRYPGWQEDKSELSEIEIMAKQWVKCEEQIQKDMTCLKPEAIFNLRYETLLAEPAKTLENLATFLDISTQPALHMAQSVNQVNSNKWRSALTESEIIKISPIIRHILESHHYL